MNIEDWSFIAHCHSYVFYLWISQIIKSTRYKAQNLFLFFFFFFCFFLNFLGDLIQVRSASKFVERIIKFTIRIDDGLFCVFFKCNMMKATKRDIFISVTEIEIPGPIIFFSIKVLIPFFFFKCTLFETRFGTGSHFKYLSNRISCFRYAIFELFEVLVLKFRPK